MCVSVGGGYLFVSKGVIASLGLFHKKYTKDKIQQNRLALPGFASETSSRKTEQEVPLTPCMLWCYDPHPRGGASATYNTLDNDFM